MEWQRGAKLPSLLLIRISVRAKGLSNLTPTIDEPPTPWRGRTGVGGSAERKKEGPERSRPSPRSRIGHQPVVRLGVQVGRGAQPPRREGQSHVVGRGALPSAGDRGLVPGVGMKTESISRGHLITCGLKNCTARHCALGSPPASTPLGDGT